MTTRRRVLVGCAGLAGLAGCSALSSDDDQPHVDASGLSEELSRAPFPDASFPVAVPESLAATHRQRARELLADVPTDPAVPNEAVAAEMRQKRERAADEPDGDEAWALRALLDWRNHRGSAADVRAAHRAATGEDDADAVAQRRRSVRETLGAFTVDWEYRGTDPVEAVLVHAPLEALVDESRTKVRPDPPYPDDPVAAPFRAGDAVEGIEEAAAAAADARALREAYLGERDAVSQWGTLTTATDHLHSAVTTTLEGVEGYVGVGPEVFDRDLAGTTAEWLFGEASRTVESRIEDVRDARADGRDATAILAAGRALAAIETLATVVEGIEDGAYQGEVTVETVRRRGEHAREAVGSAWTAEPRGLAVELGRSALFTHRFTVRRLEDDFANARRAQSRFAWAELYARTVPAATAFVAERLREADGT